LHYVQLITVITFLFINIQLKTTKDHIHTKKTKNKKSFLFLISSLKIKTTIDHEHARQVGVEPTTFCLGNRRSIHWATGARYNILFALYL
jgi:hypothetical protein